MGRRRKMDDEQLSKVDETKYQVLRINVPVGIDERYARLTRQYGNNKAHMMGCLLEFFTNAPHEVRLMVMGTASATFIEASAQIALDYVREAGVRNLTAEDRAVASRREQLAPVKPARNRGAVIGG